MEIDIDCDIISETSDSISCEESSDILPLDYRFGWSIDDNDNLINYLSENELGSMKDGTPMQVDYVRAKPHTWELKSVCGDTLDTEEDMSSTLDLINDKEDFWQL